MACLRFVLVGELQKREDVSGVVFENVNATWSEVGNRWGSEARFAMFCLVGSINVVIVEAFEASRTRRITVAVATTSSNFDSRAERG